MDDNLNLVTFIRKEYVSLFTSCLYQLMHLRFLLNESRSFIANGIHFSVTLFFGLIYEKTRFRALFFTCNIYYNPPSI